MFSLVILLCLTSEPTVCQSRVNQNVFVSLDKCYEDLPKAHDHFSRALGPAVVIKDFECVQWDTDT